jgi:hypothetical protein
MNNREAAFIIRSSYPKGTVKTWTSTGIRAEVIVYLVAPGLDAEQEKAKIAGLLDQHQTGFVIDYVNPNDLWINPTTDTSLDCISYHLKHKKSVDEMLAEACAKLRS